MIWTVLRALLSYWRRNPLQLFAYLAGLALATGLWSGVQAINSEARASYDAAADTLGQGQFDALVARDGQGIALADYIALRRAGWLVSPVIEGRLRGVRLLGIDPLTAPSGLGSVSVAGDLDTPALGRDAPLFANRETAGRLGDLDVVIDPGIAPGIAVGDIGLVQHLLERRDLSRLVILPEQPLRQPGLAEVAPGLERQASAQDVDVAELTDSFHLNLTAFGLLSFGVGLFIVHSTIGLAFEQRRPMLRTLRSLGVPLRQLVTLVSLEMLTLAAIGACLGILLGYVVAASLLPDVAATLRGLYGAQVAGTLQFRAEWWLSGFLIALLGASVALSGRIWQVAQMPLLAAARPRAWLMAGHATRRVQAWAAILLLILAGLFAMFADGLILGFGLLACMLLGAALLLPAMADYAIRAMQARASSATALWFWADTRQQLPGLSLALMALLLAISANIGVSTMVSSFRLTFVSFLDQRLAPEVFARVETREDSTALQAYLDARGIDSLPLMSEETRIAGQPVDLMGIRVGPTYRTNWRFLDESPDAWDRVAAGEAVVLNEQLARRAALWIGDDVPIRAGLVLPVAAVVGDYGNPTGQVILSATEFLKLYPDAFPNMFGIRTDDPGQLRTDVTREVGLSPGRMVDQAVIKRASLDVFERTFLVTSALNVLTLGIAGFAILMSLLTLADMRLPQLAPVWALGFARAKLGQIELLRAVVFALIVFLCALPLGLALSWVLLSIVNVAAFGWKLPMYLFPGDYALLALYAVLAAVLAALWPARRLARIPPARLLKVFSHER